MRKPAMLFTAFLLACRAGAPQTAGDQVAITGAGATFPYPLYSLWFSDYHKAHPDIEVSYQSIGSGGGIKQIIDRTVDFGATEEPMVESELAKAPGVMHLPTALGADAITFNLKGITELNLSPQSLAGIFLGAITRWDDAKIAADNPGVRLPRAPILLVHRSDGSGTTYVFTDFLSQASDNWKKKVGAGRLVNWPAGIAAKGNDGVAGRVQLLSGSIGYVELAYAAQNRMPVASVKNHDGQWVKPSATAITAAAEAMADRMPEDMRLSLIDAPGKGSYPLSSYTYVLIYRDQPDVGRGRALTGLLWWVIHEGQRSNEALFYAKLPASVVKRDEAVLRSVHHEGMSLLAGS